MNLPKPWAPRAEKDGWGVPEDEKKVKLTIRQKRCLLAVKNEDWKTYKKIPLSIRVSLDMYGLTWNGKLTDLGDNILKNN